MDRKAIIAIVLSAIFLFAYPYIIKRIYPPQLQPVETTAVDKGRVEKAPSGVVTVPDSGVAAEREKISAREELTVVETPLYRAVLTNIGGAIKKWELKKYRVSMEEGSPHVNLVGTLNGESTFRTRLITGSSSETVVFKPAPNKRVVVSKGETPEVVFRGVTSNGLSIEKRYIFNGEDYDVGTELRIKNLGKKPVDGFVETDLAAWYKAKKKKSKKSYFHTGPLVRSDKTLLRIKKKEPRKSGSGNILWVGIENKYFLTALVPATDIPTNWSGELVSQSLSRARSQFAIKLSPGDTAVYKYKSFMGPKKYDLLLKEKKGLVESIEFGFFAPMAKPMLVVLNFFQRYVVNYGLAVILLTVLIKIIFYPLTKHSLTSMQGMKKIQPQLVAIKERYKNDKEKLNKEIMGLYKKHKINPVSGCLPMILQIPVFIALYEVLYVAIELRHAPLFLWITDLSAKDPYYVTPILMGASMFVQQKMSPTSPDPTQAKMMLFLPIIFTVMFLNFPSGLVIYWLVNNLLSIAQQYHINLGQKKAAVKV
ncbi:MAG: membrane protein insertase YidC [Thermodesulfobacteriota bacterium]|nr:MAG: membrane protein insertase YidC [Thermodesulfobacteriota bacterium]